MGIRRKGEPRLDEVNREANEPIGKSGGETARRPRARRSSFARRIALSGASVAAVFIIAVAVWFAQGGAPTGAGVDAEQQALPKAESLAEENPATDPPESERALPFEQESLDEFDGVLNIVDGEGNKVALGDVAPEDYRGFLFKLASKDGDAGRTGEIASDAVAAGRIAPVHGDVYSVDSLDTLAELFAPDQLEYVELDSRMHLIGDVGGADARNASEGADATAESNLMGGTTTNPAPDYPPTDPDYVSGALWNLDMLNVQAAWEAGLDGDPYVYNSKALRDAPVKVAVIDTGLYGTGDGEDHHEDLDYANMFSGTNFVTDQAGTPDAHGHGTFVAGLIAAKANNGVGVVGAQPSAQVVSEKVFDTGSAATSDVIGAIYAAVDDDHVDVINMSLGGEYNEKALETACDYAVGKGVLVVASAGNDGVSTPNYPAAYDSVVGVASVNSSQQRSTWSQYGRSVFVTAPGENVRSTFKGASDAYKTASGTSFSGPEVAALAAMCKSVYPDIDQDTFKQLLVDTSHDLGAKGYDDFYGWGLVDFGAMAQAVLSSQVLPWYNVSFDLSDKDGRAIALADATITLAAAEDISWEADESAGIAEAGAWSEGEQIQPEAEGGYRLHRGTYAYSVVVDGKYTATGTFKTYAENQRVPVTLADAYAVTLNVVSSEGAAVEGATQRVAARDGRVEAPKSGSAESAQAVYDLASGIYTYEAQADGFELAAGTFTVQHEDDAIDAVLYRTDELTAIGFAVTDKDGGAEIAGATITVTDASGVTIAAQADGTWRLAKGATYTASASKPGFESSNTQFTVGSEESQTVALSMQRASSRITFNVVDEKARAISAASVKVANAEGESVDSVPGNTLQFSLSEGDYSYEATAPGYSVKSGSFGVALDSYTITVVLEAVPSTVTFSVVDDATGAAIADATVKVNLSDRLRVIEPNAPYTYLLAPADYDYTVFKDGYKIAQGTFTVAGEDMTVAVRLEAQGQGAGYAGGSGTEDDPYLIANEDQLRYLAAQTELVRVTSTSAPTNKKETLSGCFRLLNDIELTGGEWMPIGNYENGSNWVAFGGEFDGGGHTISGIQISQSTYDYEGLFGYVRGAHIHDLVVDGSIYVNGKSGTSGGSYVGGLVGGVYSANDPIYTSGNTPPTTIERCGNLASVTGRYAVGGIVGSSQGATPSTAQPDGAPDEALIIIRDCWNKGELHAMLNGSYMRASGTGQVAAGKRAGGIVGSAQYTFIENCYNAGDVNTGESAGGIAGYANLSRITSCYNSGMLMQHSNASGEGGKTGAAAGATVRTEVTYTYGLNRDDNYANVMVGTQGSYTSISNSSMLSHADIYRTADFVTTLNEHATSAGAAAVYALGHDFPMLYWEVVEGVTPAQTPVVIEHPRGIDEVDAYVQGAEAEELTARIEDIAEEDGSVTWQWFVSDTDSFKNATPAPKGIGQGMEARYVPSTAEVGVKYYFCVFTNRLGLDLKESEASAVTHGAVIYVRESTPAETPRITQLNPSGSSDFNLTLTAKQGTDTLLSVFANVSDGGTLSYQWYYSATGSGAGDALAGATAATYNVNTATLGTGYYYVEVTNTTGPGNVSRKLSDWITVTVEPYSISNYQELASFRTAVNSGNTFEGQIVYLTGDVAVPDGVDWAPIGTTDHPFMGTFMGGSGYAGSDPDTVAVHKVENLSIDGNSHGNDKLGLFGVVSGATICDVQVGGHVTGASNTNAGLLVGQAYASGNTASSIENCGTLAGSGVEGAWSIGGLVGYGAAALSNCSNHADVHSHAYAGSLGSGTITADSKYAVGGVSGYQSSGNMLGCYNTGTITVDAPSADDGTVCATRVGGVAGATGYYSGAASCYNAGKLEVATVATSQYERGALYIGSVVGYLNSGNGVNNYYKEGTWERGTDGSDHIEAAEARSAQFMKTAYFTELLNTGTASYSYGQYRTSANGVPHLVWEQDNVGDDVISSAEPYITDITSVDFPDIKQTLKGTYFQNTSYIEPIIVLADTPDGGAMRYEWRMRQAGADDDAWQVVASGAMEPDENGKNAQAPVTVDVSQIGNFEYVCEIFNKRADANAEPLEESMYTPTVTITVKDATSVMSLRNPNAENSADNPWIIDTGAKMKFFADIVNGNEVYRPMSNSTFEGQYVELAADIDISDYAPWEPVGANTSTYSPTAGVFKGVFDGANHTIEGLSIVNPDRNDYNGLFGQARMATIRNLEVAGTVQMDSASAYGTGGVVGYGYGCFIENVVSRVNVTGAVNTGGIVGYAGTCKILDCENMGDVTMNAASMAGSYGGHDVGGIAGFMFVSASAPGAGVYNCFNNGTVSGGLYDGDYAIGAILGRAGSGFVASEHLKHNYYRADSIVVEGGTGTGFGGGSYEPVADATSRCMPLADTNSSETAWALDTSDGSAPHSARWGNFARTDLEEAQASVHLVRADDEKVGYRVDTSSKAANITTDHAYASVGETVQVSWQGKPGFTVQKVYWKTVGSDEKTLLGEGDGSVDGMGMLTAAPAAKAAKKTLATQSSASFVMPADDVEFYVEYTQDSGHRYELTSEVLYQGAAAPSRAGRVAFALAGQVADNAPSAIEGDEVTVELAVADAYQVKSVRAIGSFGTAVELTRVDGLHYSFKMPADAVKVSVTLEDVGAAAENQAESQDVEGGAIHYRNPDERYATADLLYDVMVLSGTMYGIDDPWMTYELERWTNPGLFQQTYSFADGSTHAFTGLDVAKWLRNRIGEDIPANTQVSFEGADGTVAKMTYGDLTALTYSRYDATGQPEVRGLPVLLYFGVDGVPNTNGAMGVVFGQTSPTDDNAAKQVVGLRRICVGADMSSMQHVYAPYDDFDAICGGKADDKQGHSTLTIRLYKGGKNSSDKGVLAAEKAISLKDIEGMANGDRANIHRGYYSAHHYEDKTVATANSQYTDYYEGYDLYQLLKSAGVPYDPQATVQFFQSGMNGLENSWETVNVSLGYLAGNGDGGEGDYSGNKMTYDSADDSGNGPSSGTMTNVRPLLLYGKNGLPLVWSSGTTGVGYNNYNYRGPMIAFLPQNAVEGGAHVGSKSAFSCYLGLIEVYLTEDATIDTVSKEELRSAVEAAEKARAGVSVSADGKDVAANSTWTTKEERDALDAAVASAQAVLASEDVTQYKVDAATKALGEAVTAYEKAKKAGKMQAESPADAAAVKAATAKVEQAAKVADGIVVSKDGKDVEAGKKWVTPEAKKAFDDAVATAKAVAGKPGVTVGELAAAQTALDNAIAAFNRAQQPGTKAHVATSAEYAIAKGAVKNGSFTVSATKAKPGTVVTVKAKPAKGYELAKITYAPAGGKVVDITKAGKFAMPAKDATVSVTFKKMTPGSDPSQKAADGTALGAGASAAAAEVAITACGSDEGPKGSKFAKLRLTSPKQTKTSVTLKWAKVKGAKKYVVYGNMCGKKHKMKKIGVLTKSTLKVTKAAGKKLKKGKYYKFIVVALDKGNCVISSSKAIHIATKGGKVGNYSKVTTKAKKGKVSLAKGKKFKLRAKQVAASKKLKVRKHRGLKYESANKAIATVSSKGVVTAKKKGVCYVYAYAQSGVCARVKVTVTVGGAKVQSASSLVPASL